jgi:hypothetical protein
MERTIAKAFQKEIEAILDMKVARRTRGKDYFRYLIKWKNRPEEDATWMTTTINFQVWHKC